MAFRGLVAGTQGELSVWKAELRGLGMGKSNQQPPIAAPIVCALMQLHTARQEAVHAGENLWNHAVPVEVLTTAGLSRDHLTWMDQMGWIELGYDVAGPVRGRRVFAKSARAANSVNWCAILTPAGLVALRRCHLADQSPIVEAAQNGKRNGSTNGHAVGGTVDVTASRINGNKNGHVRTASRVRRPKWNERTRELRLGKLLVKRLRCHAPNQILILSTFQEEGWPKAIDDPLPPSHEGETRRRLSDTIKALNRNQVTQLLRFRSNGTGEVVTWELVRNAQDIVNGKSKAAHNGHSS